jgi:hypothetical protein
MSSTNTTPDNVYMEFQGPVPGILGPTAGFHAVIWVQAPGGAGFTRPSAEEREYYASQGKPVPEWQCEYCDFDGVLWHEATLSVELWRGRVKLRSLVLPGRRERTEAEVLVELPELARFLHVHNLAQPKLTLDFHEALLQAAATAGVIERGLAPDVRPAASSPTRFTVVVRSWWRGALRRAWPRRRVA